MTSNPSVRIYTQGSGSASSSQFPSNPVVQAKDPTTTDVQGQFGRYPVGQLWINSSSNSTFILSSFSSSLGATTANWIVIGGGSYGIAQLNGNTGTALPSGGVVTVSGSNGITTTGSGSTLSITPSAAGYPITPFVVGPSGQAGYQTIQSAINAANSASGGVVYIQPGSYTENLTLYSGVDLYGTPAVSQNQGSSVTITGTHTPPNSGHVGCNSICFLSTTDVFSSSAAGTTHIVLLNCESAVQNGRLFNLANWAGIIEVFDHNSETAGAPWAVNDGFINNTGGATILVFTAGIGGGSNVMTVSGPCVFGSVQIACPLTIGNGATVSSYGTQYSSSLTLSGNGSITSNGELFAGGSSAAITMSSSGASAISNALVTSSNNPAIAGAGAGTLTLGNITFNGNSNIAGTLTLAWMTTRTS